jgi:hypothetical protein
MAEFVVGLIVSLPGLITSCAELYDLSVKARGHDPELDRVITRVELEQLRFALWLQHVGLVENGQAKLALPPAVQTMLYHHMNDIKGLLPLKFTDDI